jgi:hypothetical protein
MYLPSTRDDHEDHKMSRLKTYGALSAAFLIITIGGWWILHNVSIISTGGFGIYLLDTDEVIVSDEDIISYMKSSHEVKLTEEGAKKIEKLSLTVPLNGTRFVIKINGKAIYSGWFWSPISSISCSSVVIETIVRNNTIKIETGYPTSHFQGEDPRNNPEVFNYLAS